jgi:hypothetical protein
VVLEDVVELLECEIVEVIVGDAVEDALELLEVVDEVLDVIVELIEELFGLVDEADDEVLLPLEVEVVVVELVLEGVLDLLVAVIP